MKQHFRVRILCFISFLGTLLSTTLREFLEDRFHDEFNSKCSKYPFVNQYINKLEHPGDKYLVYVYQDQGLKNGGLGDRLGGLVSATLMSLRFNRTLLLRNHNELHRIFRPYHPEDIKSDNPKYSYFNWSSWTNYNFGFENNDATEYDLWWCINNTGGTKSQQCAMDNGDASQPNILYRSNRCYLCRDDRYTNLLSNQQMRELGIGPTADLFEVAGCMLRLVLWPTKELWDEIEKIYTNFEQTILPHGRRLQFRKTQEAIPGRPLDNDSMYFPSHHHTTKHHYDSFHQVGMQFRCGDKSFIHRGVDDSCVYDPAVAAAAGEARAQYFNTGNPLAIGLCAKTVLFNHTAEMSHHHHWDSGSMPAGGETLLPATATTRARKGRRSLRGEKATLHRQTQDVALQQAPTTALQEPVLPPPPMLNKFSMVYITSDNQQSAEQMHSATNHPYTLISPAGCHIEMDPSVQCHIFTVSYWFILSLSNEIVTQTLGDTVSNGPTSSFSRYAGIYGLKDNPFRDGRDCNYITTNLALSRMQQSNWFCV